MSSSRFRGVERIDGTPIVLAAIVATNEDLQPWAAALRFELVHSLSLALRVDASVAHPTGYDAEFVLEGVVYPGDSGCCASFSLRRLQGAAVVWTDRLSLPGSAAGPVMPHSVLRLARGIVIAIRIDGARGLREACDRAALQAWAHLWARPQTEATNGAAFKALSCLGSSRIIHAPASTTFAYAQWRASRYGWNGLDRAVGAVLALQAANDAVEGAPGDADARFVLAMAQFPVGDAALAEAHLRAGIEADPSHAPCHGNLGFALLRQGRLEAAQASCELALSISPHEPLGCVWHASLSIIHAQRGDVAAAGREAALAVAANPKHRFGWLASAVAAGLAAAPEATKRYVERLGKLGPADGVGPEFWSWCEPLLEHMRSIASPQRNVVARLSPSVRITTLGSFELEREGLRIEWPRKAPRRPLEILKFLIVQGGRPVAPTVLMEALWPGEAGPQVRRRLDTALYRLRQLLGEGAVVSTNGSVALSSMIEIDAHRFARSNDAALYAGIFLPDDLHVAWTVPMRESLREHLQVLLVDQAERALEARRYDNALRICETGIVHHPTGESLYRLAIRTCRLAGWRGEGARLYERCRACLSSELGLRPSRATEDEHLQLIRDS